ncbi:hypothetical protein [Chitinimonas lacunae]|uniref:Uncharacterized protein n=1 Tax=Chitinimonas lacunae TaxID=1963018 RepID=A0ABV8MUG9_9NEIS
MSAQTDDKLQTLRRQAAEIARRDPPGSAGVLRGWMAAKPKPGAGK